MFRKCFAVVWLAVIGGTASADSAPQTHDAAHQYDREYNGSVDQLRLQRMLAEIIETQRRVSEGILNCQNDHRHHPSLIEPLRYADPRIGDSSVMILAKGGSVTVRHSIEWRLYKESELEVTVTASDASLVVPDQLVLEFEKHQFRFEYPVKAGEKAGEFTITLSPAAGKPVTVQVIVK